MNKILLAALLFASASFANIADESDVDSGERVQVVGTLWAGQSLGTNDSLRSHNGAYTLTVQPDGNVVLWGPSGVKWSSWFGKPGVTPPAGYGQKVVTSFVMQTDGNLVGYGPSGTWSSETWGFGGAGLGLTLQDDGNMVIYRGAQALWATNQGNFVRWDNALQGCFATPGNASLGICFTGNTARAIVQPPNSPFPWRCGGINPMRVYQNALEGKMYVYGTDFWGNPVNGTSTVLCEPMQNQNPFPVNPQFSNQVMPIPYLSTWSDSANGNASVTINGLWTSKAGMLNRVPSIPNL